jgi:CHASE2 domain-containing sensor protein
MFSLGEAKISPLMFAAGILGGVYFAYKVRDDRSEPVAVKIATSSVVCFCSISIAWAGPVILIPAIATAAFHELDVSCK